jgi:MFS family permease
METKIRSAPEAAAGPRPTAGRAWLILAVLVLFSVAAPFNQFKVPPLMPVLMRAFDMSLGNAGWLMSVFAVTGLILALPAGFLFQKMGFRVTGTLAIGSVAIGAALGAISSGACMMLISRVIEGVGTSLIAVVAPAIIAVWFAADRRGMPMGIWAIWVPLGSTLMMVAAPRLAGTWGWQGVWWVGCIYALVMAALFLMVIKPPAAVASPAGEPSAMPADLKRVLGNRNLWLLSLTFGCFNFTIIAFVTWAPTFLNTVRQVPLPEASFLVSLVLLVNIFSCPAAGWLSDRLRTRRKLFTAGMALFGLPLLVIVPLSQGAFAAIAVAMGVLTGPVAGTIFASSVETVGDERLGGMAMGVMQVGQNAGMLLGPMVFGGIVQTTGSWTLAFAISGGVSVIGAVSGWMARVR